MIKDFHPLGAALVHAMGEGAVEKFFSTARGCLFESEFICWALDNALVKHDRNAYEDLHSLLCDFQAEIVDSMTIGNRICMAYGGWCGEMRPSHDYAYEDLYKGRLQWLERLEHYVAHGGHFPQPQLPE